VSYTGRRGKDSADTSRRAPGRPGAGRAAVRSARRSGSACLRRDALVIQIAGRAMIAACAHSRSTAQPPATSRGQAMAPGVVSTPQGIERKTRRRICQGMSQLLTRLSREKPISSIRFLMSVGPLTDTAPTKLPLRSYTPVATDTTPEIVFSRLKARPF
jgi:hypothetical protein